MQSVITFPVLDVIPRTVQRSCDRWPRWGLVELLPHRGRLAINAFGVDKHGLPPQTKAVGCDSHVKLTNAQPILILQRSPVQLDLLSEGETWCIFLIISKNTDWILSFAQAM